MTWKSKSSLLLAVAVLFLTPGLMAQGPHHAPRGRVINKRQVRQQKRIGQGVTSGEETPSSSTR